MKEKLVMGIVAHVDAGKTTLSEGILYQTGKIKNLGRVDNQNAYLDTNCMERERGITIFSKEAVFSLGDKEITLLDTPGHVDFSAEMERTLQVLDYAVLVISGADGVQGHTLTLWRLLAQYEIPTILFINKMDQPDTSQDKLMEELKKQLDSNCVWFDKEEGDDWKESLAMCQESLLEQYLETGEIAEEQIQKLIKNREVFPCYFGSALKVEGVAELLEGIRRFCAAPVYPDAFGAKVFKIARDEQNNRLTYMKVTGGVLRVKDVIEGKNRTQELVKEKVNQIRIYSGENYQTETEVCPGTICAVTGLTQSYPGQGLGVEQAADLPLLEPVLNYRILLPDGISPNAFLPSLRQLEEEEPELKIVWNEKAGELQAQLMGEVQIEILKRMIWDRFQVRVEFDTGSIVYKETIAHAVEGVGHFEPLRHYAEVHLLLEPAEPGTGIQIRTQCSEDLLDKNWQRLILTHIAEKEHIGVITGSTITDMTITLLSGKAHKKHTEGGDFRQATYRAIRQGLMKATGVLLEPYYQYRLEVPAEMTGRAMADLERMQGEFSAPKQQDDSCILTGSVPVAAMQNYQKEVASYTKGKGKLFCTLKGYYPCHNQEEIVEKTGYYAEEDTENPSGSVFCSHGSGFMVPWDEVEKYMHLPFTFCEQEEENDEVSFNRIERKSAVSDFIGEEEVNAILERASAANKGVNPRKAGKTIAKREQVYVGKKAPVKKSTEKYLLVDGYNIVFAWKELNELAKENIDAARSRLMDIMCNYQGYKKCTLILVFDAYKVKGSIGMMQNYHNIHVVYTKEAETADQYIEKLAHKMGRDYDVTVATSDGLEQLIIRGQGCHLLSARDFYQDVKYVEEQIRNML